MTDNPRTNNGFVKRGLWSGWSILHVKLVIKCCLLVINFTNSQKNCAMIYQLKQSKSFKSSVRVIINIILIIYIIYCYTTYSICTWLQDNMNMYMLECEIE